MSKAIVSMEIEPWPKALILLRSAVECGVKAKPPNWRPSEWAMTKASAKRAVDEIEKQLAAGAESVSLDVFDWTLLEGELVRFAKVSKREDAVELALLIRRRLMFDPKASELLANAKLISDTQRALAKSELARERLKKKLDRLTRAAKAE